MPPSRREAVGKAWLKETLPTNSPREAELLKWPVIGRLKNAIAGVKTEDDRSNRDREALAWKEAMDHEARQLEAEGMEPWRATLPLALTDKAEQIEATEGEAVARAFVDVASGTATPLETLVDDWLKEREVSGRTEQAFRYAVKRRAEGKSAGGFIFDELPEQTSDARGRGAPITQEFTRDRRDLGVEDKEEGARQSRIDLHSFRRWFIKKAVEALQDGAAGFTAWTIADVVGHSKDDGPLPLTMGRYPGRADAKALRACVESVRLPSAQTAAAGGLQST